MELRDILGKAVGGGGFEGGVSTIRDDWLGIGWLWLRWRALRMREFAVRVSSSSESSTAGRREVDEEVAGGIIEEHTEHTLDSDPGEPWPLAGDYNYGRRVVVVAKTTSKLLGC